MSLDRRRLAVKTAKLRSKSKVPTSEPGYCLREVRECLVVGAKAHTAYLAWLAAERVHRAPSDPKKFAEFLKSIPRGVPIFWKGGSDGAGHVAIATGYGSNCWSTDIVRAGYFDKAPITQIHKSWGLSFLGWSEDINGVRVYP